MESDPILTILQIITTIPFNCYAYDF